MSVKDDIFRYRVITNLDCNMNPYCYFCYQTKKSNSELDINKARETMKKVGVLSRCTIMGGESTLLKNLPDYISLCREYVKDDVCLVTNGILLNRGNLANYKDAGLTEVAISISNIKQYHQRRRQCLLSKEFVPNTRINIPKCWGSTGDRLVYMLREMLTDGFFVEVCEDLMGRYGEFDFVEKLPAKLISDDNHSFYIYEWEGHRFSFFGHYSGYNKTDIIISPVGNFCEWDKYCKAVGNTCLR